jgi:mono/diheme cytochrome c family protein
MPTSDRRHARRPRPAGGLLAAALAAALVVGACGGDDDDAASDATAAGLGGPAGPGADALPAGDAAAGEPVYQQSCASCHGDDLRGTDRGPSHLSQVYEPNHHPDAAFVAAVRNGSAQHHWDFGDMPAVEGLTDEQIADVIAYVRSVQESEGFEPYPPG